VDIVARAARKRIANRYNLTAPQGVRGRNSDHTRLRAVLGWEPAVSLEEGLLRTYRWIEAQLRAGSQATARIAEPSSERHAVPASP
jgi:GDP-D-mannose 3',5'-epimerase